MRNPHGFDYHQPNRDTLAGVYLEVSDLDPETPPAESPASQEKPVLLSPVEQLFGITVSVEDDVAKNEDSVS